MSRLRRFFIDEEFHDAGSKGKGRLIETRDRKRERRKDKLETRNLKLEIGEEKGVLS
jgi:hypothetical protein